MEAEVGWGEGEGKGRVSREKEWRVQTDRECVRGAAGRLQKTEEVRVMGNPHKGICEQEH